MDRGPLRASRPAETRATSRPEPVRRNDEVTQHAAGVDTRTAAIPHHTASAYARNERKKSSKLSWIIIAFVVLASLAVVGWMLWSNSRPAAAVDSSKYQAVFFTNNQVYFGKLTQLSKDKMKLTDVYYLQSQSGEDGDSENPQKTSSEQTGPRLIKLGSEIHGPEDAMIISTEHVLFYENLKTDGQVAQSIEQYKKNN